MENIMTKIKENVLTKWTKSGSPDTISHINKEGKSMKDRPVTLYYTDGSELLVAEKDFNRAFGCIVGLTYEVCKKEFAISTVI